MPIVFTKRQYYLPISSNYLPFVKSIYLFRKSSYLSSKVLTFFVTNYIDKTSKVLTFKSAKMGRPFVNTFDILSKVNTNFF